MSATSSSSAHRQGRPSAKQNFLGMMYCFMHWSDVSRMWKSNRRVFRRIVADVAGQHAVTKKESDRLYNVFTTYFLDQALHHEKAHRAHRFDMNVKVARHPDSLIRYNFVSRKRDRKRKNFVHEMHLDGNSSVNASRMNNPTMSEAYHTYNGGDNASRTVYDERSRSDQSQERLVASDEIFFHRCRDYLGDRLSGILHDIMKNVKIEFMAVQYTDAKQKAWANWEWVGALYIPNTQAAFESSTSTNPAAAASTLGSRADQSPSRMQSLKDRVTNRKKGGHRVGKKGRRGSVDEFAGSGRRSSVASSTDYAADREAEVVSHARTYPDTREASAAAAERRWQARQVDDVSSGQHVV